MNRTIKTAIARLAFFCFALASLPVFASPLTWQIDSTASSISLAIPDTQVNLDGTLATARIRNQGVASNTWNAGNKAFISGVFETENSSGNIQFLPSSAGDFIGLNSGNYRPNPAAFNSANTTTTSPNGQYENSSTAPAVFAARVRTVVSLVTADPAYFSIQDVSYSMNSGVLPIGGTPTLQTFNASALSFGILSSLLNVDGIPIPIVGQVIPDLVGENFSTSGTNQNPNGQINTMTPHGIEMTIPISTLWHIELGDGTALPVNVSGVLVAHLVPEPSSLLLGTVGIVGLAGTARCGRKRRRQNA